MIFPLSITMFPSEIPDVWCQIPRFVSHPSSFSAACHAKCLTALDSGQIELIELVLFDASGTIAVISVKRGPDRFLLLWLQQVLDVGICLQLKVLNNFISQHIYIYAYIPGDLVGSTFAMSFRMDCWTPVVVPAGNATNLSLPNFTSGDARV